MLSLRCWAAALTDSLTGQGWASLASRFGTRPAPKALAHHTAAGVLTKTIEANRWPMDWSRWANADQNYFDSDRKIVADPA